MASDTPQVSVIIPVYNQARFIRGAVGSVVAQTYADWEIVVVDDGSTDDTPRVLAELAGRISRMRVIRQPNRGRAAARNAGISHACGVYAAFLDADDVWFPDKLERQVAALEACPRAGAVYARAVVVGLDGVPDRRGLVIGAAPASPRAAFADLAMLNRVPLSTAMVRRECLDEVGWFDEGLVYIEDWELWLRLAARYEFVFTPQVLAGYRAEMEDTLAKMDRCGVQETVPRMIERAFDNLPAGSSFKALRPGALARAHLIWGACLEYALGRISAAQGHVEKAVQLDGSLLSVPDAFSKVVAQFAAWYAADGRAFVECVFANAPPGLFRKPGLFKRRALARYWLELGYQMFLIHRWRQAAGYVLRASWHDPGMTGRRPGGSVGGGGGGCRGGGGGGICPKSV
jgi:glycosyltransferase involved in cell wall biosynthesis